MTPHLHRTGIALVLAAVAFTAAADGPGLSLRIPDEAAPAGSSVQFKVEVTEAKPISTGRGKIKIKSVAATAFQQSVLAHEAAAAAPDVDIVLMSGGADTYGLAFVDGDELTFSVTSPSSLFGTNLDSPILAISGTVPNASSGTSFPVELDASGFRDPSGAVYPTEIKNGSVTVNNGAVTITSVSPGSAVVPAGGVVRISGANFTPATRLQLAEASIVEQRFVSSHQIDVVLGQTTRMHGLRIRARNDDNGNRSECEYYAYERTIPSGASSNAAFAHVVPLFSTATYTTATIDLPQQPSSRKRRAAGPSRGSGSAMTIGFALQNQQTAAATVTVELLDAAGHPYAINTMSVGPDRSLVRELSEVFGPAAPPSSLRIRSNVFIQVLGLTADHSSGSAAALPPH